MNDDDLTDEVNKGFEDSCHAARATRYVTNTSTSDGNITCNDNLIPAVDSDEQSGEY